MKPPFGVQAVNAPKISDDKVKVNMKLPIETVNYLACMSASSMSAAAKTFVEISLILFFEGHFSDTHQRPGAACLISASEEEKLFSHGVSEANGYFYCVKKNNKGKKHRTAQG